MTENSQTYSIKPADRLSKVAEYYFSRIAEGNRQT